MQSNSHHVITTIPSRKQLLSQKSEWRIRLMTVVMVVAITKVITNYTIYISIVKLIMPTRLEGVNIRQTLKNYLVNKSMQCAYFVTDKFEHTKQLFQLKKRLNVYKLNILNVATFVYKINQKTAPNVFLSMVLKQDSGN